MSQRESPERRSQPETTAKEVERILAGAERIAEEVGPRRTGVRGDAA
jgi:hypothetical protein